MHKCSFCSSNVELWSRARDVEYDSISDFFEYMFCQNCDLLSIHNPPIKRLSEIYPKNYYSFDENAESYLIKLKKRFDLFWFRKQISKHLIIEPKHILDLGGGAGYHSKLLQSVYPEAIATVVDFDSSSISMSGNDNRIFVECDLNVEFPQGEYDVIVAWNILEHVLSPKNFLSSCNSALSESGVLLIQTPNFLTISARIFRKTYWGGLHAPRHFTLFSRFSLENHIDRAGLRIRDFQYVQGAHFWSVSIANLFRLKAKKEPEKHS